MNLTFYIDNDSETVYLVEGDRDAIRQLMKTAPIMALQALKGVEDHVFSLKREAEQAVTQAISAFDPDDDGAAA